MLCPYSVLSIPIVKLDVFEALEITVKRGDSIFGSNRRGRQVGISEINILRDDSLEGIRQADFPFNLNSASPHKRQNLPGNLGVRKFVRGRKRKEHLVDRNGSDKELNFPIPRLLKKLRRGRGLLRIVIAQEAKNDIRIQANPLAHRDSPSSAAFRPISARAFFFSLGSRCLLSEALPSRDMMSGVGETRALPSGFKSQRTWEVFQSLRNFLGIVVCPLLDIRVFTI